MNLIKYKNLYFALSLLVIIPGLLSLFLFGLKPAIDFSGGTSLTFSGKDQINANNVKSVFAKNNIEIINFQQSQNSAILKIKPIDQKQNNKIISDLQNLDPNIKEDEFATVGPTIGKETTINAILGVAVASVLIVLYIAWSFRKVRKPANSLQFGLCAIIALLHDGLVLLGVFSILGHFFGVQVDSLFVTAVLTVIGFSVHDTIVVFDRIRENLHKSSASFEEVVNASLLQTLGRSLNTSLTVILVLFTLLLFGGDNTKWFIVALLVGIISGTYSSIFNAAPLLVLWNELSTKRKA